MNVRFIRKPSGVLKSFFNVFKKNIWNAARPVHVQCFSSRNNFFVRIQIKFKQALSGLIQYLAAGSPIKMMKNAFYSSSKAYFIFKILKFFSWLFGHVGKQLDQKDKVNFKFYDVTTWLTNNCNPHIGNILRSKGNQTIKFG